MSISEKDIERLFKVPNSRLAEEITNVLKREVVKKEDNEPKLRPVVHVDDGEDKDY